MTHTDVGRAVVVAPHRLVEQAEFVSDDPDLAGTMTMTWSLEVVDDGTLVTIAATGVPDGISRQDHATAFASTRSNLGAHVTRRVGAQPAGGKVG